MSRYDGKEIYYIKSGNSGYVDITNKWNGLNILSLNNFNTLGKTKNISVQEWVDSNELDINIPEKICYEVNDVEMSILVSDFKDASVDVHNVYESFITYIKSNRFYIKSLYSQKENEFICIDACEPTSEVLMRSSGCNYITATITIKKVNSIGLNTNRVIMTSESNAEVLAIMYANNLCASANKMTKSEAEKVTSFGTIFRESAITHFEEMVYFTNITTLGDNAFRDCASLTTIDCSNVASLGGSVFYNCSALQSVNLTNKVTSIPINTFARCTSLTSVGDLSNVESLGDYAFYGCSALTSVGDLSNVTTIGNSVFNRCSALQSVNLTNKVTSLGDYAFSMCTKLQSITILTDTAPTLGTGVFGTSASSYTGKDVTTTKTLNIKQGATGYDTGDWVDVLLNADKCNFTLNYV